MTDQAGGKTVEMMINRLIADSAWGSRSSSSWKPLYTKEDVGEKLYPPTDKKPDIKDILSFSNFIDLIKYPTESSTPSDSDETKDRVKKNYKLTKKEKNC